VVGQHVVPQGQKAEPLGHWQLPLVQTVPPVQTLPQEAQFVFVPRVAQAPLQSAWPLGHWQEPFTQFVPPVQTLPQAPQLFRSVFSLTQVVPPQQLGRAPVQQKRGPPKTPQRSGWPVRAAGPQP
jgi:hypothetical protein